MNILIVEDDRALNCGIAMSFRDETVLQAFSLAEAREKMDHRVDVMILDIGLPDGSGLDFCREVRAYSNVPILFLTANDMELDVVAGLETGADDYITKPFSLAVLRARVHAATRRKDRADAVFRDGAFVFDFETMTFSQNGAVVELSKTEQKLLRILTANIGITLTRDTLLDRVWSGGAEFVEENALSVTMKRLREKLPGIPVKTVYGIGYVWERRT